MASKPNTSAVIDTVVALCKRRGFVFPCGAIYGGTPSVSLSATCGTAAPPGSSACTQLQNSLAGERAQLASDVTAAKWYPVLNIGLAYRF